MGKRSTLVNMRCEMWMWKPLPALTDAKLIHALFIILYMCGVMCSIACCGSCGCGCVALVISHRTLSPDCRIFGH